MSITTKTCGTGTNVLNWSNASRITVADRIVSQSLEGSTLVDTIKATNFGFSIPLSDTIIGVQFDVVSGWLAVPDGSGFIPTSLIPVRAHPTDDFIGRLRATITKDGSSPVGTPQVLSMPEILDSMLFGGVSDLMGTTLNPFEVNTSSFGAILEVPRDLPSSPPDVPVESTYSRYIDVVRCTIYHNPPGGSLTMLRDQVRQNVIIGPETTFSTFAAGTVRLRHARIQPQPNTDFKEHRPAGEKLPNHQLLLKEFSEGPIDGIPTYDELPYLLASQIAKPNTSQIGTGAYRHVFYLDNRIKDAIQSYSCQYGDPDSRAHRVVGMIVKALGMNFRHDAADLSGSIMAQPIEDGVTLTNGAATVQTITQSGTGTFALRFRGQETAALTAGAGLTASAVQTALRALPFINSSTELTVAGASGGPFTVTFGNANSGPFRGYKQPLLESRTLTPTPSVSIAMTTVGSFIELPGVPILPRHLEIFMTDVYANLAASKLTNAFVSQWDMSDRAAPVFNLDRASTGFFDWVEPTNIDSKVMLMVEAGSNGMSFLPKGRSDIPLWFRILATGPAIGSSGFNHRMQFDSCVKIGNFGPFQENQEVYAFEYQLNSCFDDVNNQALILTFDNGIASYN